jgi:hypothetical protein
VWNVSYQEYGMGFCGEYSYTISDDTLINNTVYHKIMKTGHDFSMTYYANPSPHWVCDHSVAYGNYTNYTGALREDISLKKVFFIPPSDTALQLLYDFNLNVGDSLKGYLSLCNDCSKVTSIDSILINTTYRKRWNFQYSGQPGYSIIEGIGSSCGLLNPYTNFEYFSNLDCFSQNGQTLYPFYSASAACALLTSIGENSKEQNALTIFPNPSNGLFQLSANNSDFINVEVTNLLGTIIKKSEIKNGSFELDLSNESQGIYFVRVSDNKGKSVVRKVVKQ